MVSVGMAEPFRMRAGDGREWIVYPSADPHGDGYVRTADAEIRADGMAARTTVTFSIESGRADLARFLTGLASDWRGWEGTRHWQAMGHEMEIDARHDGRATVTLAVTVRRPARAWADDAWSARVVFAVEAGEELATLTGDIASRLDA